MTTVTLLSALTIGLAVTAEPNNQTLKCEAGNYAVGEDASVTCFFHRDVGRTMHHIYVTQYPFDTVNISTQAMICFRIHTKELQCKLADGYSFNNVVSDNLTLAIPEVRRRFAGRYSCQLVPPEGIPRSTCDLNVNGSALTCQTGSFTEGEMASVTCYFHKNIENTIHHIYVIRYPYNTTENSTTALVCFRLHNKKLECKTEEGYIFNGIVSHKLTLEIPKVRKRFAGRYSCQIVPPDGVPLDTCDLNVKGTAPPWCYAGSYTEGEQAQVTCFFHKNIENTIHHIYVIRYPYNTTENPTTALVCLRLHDKQLECKTEEGYSFGGIVSEMLFLIIHEVRKRFAGRYSCQIVPTDGAPSVTCDLNVKGGPSPVSTQGDAHDSGLSLAAYILLTVILVIVTILVFVFVICVWKLQAKKKNAAQAPNEYQLEPLQLAIRKELETLKAQYRVAGQSLEVEEEERSDEHSAKYTVASQTVALEPLVAGHVDARRTQESSLPAVQTMSRTPQVRYTPAPQNVGSEEYEPVRDLALKPLAAEHVDARRTQRLREKPDRSDIERVELPMLTRQSSAFGIPLNSMTRD